MVNAANILVVDDDKDVCELLEEALKSAGYDVKAINDPELALPALKGGRFHLVVLDLNMPGKNGLEVFEEVRKFDPEMGVIIATGYPSVETAAAAMRLGGADYIQKPFNIERFLTAIESALNKRGAAINPEHWLNVQIGERIRSYRSERGLTQKELAYMANLSKSQVSQIEIGSSGASVSSLFRIAEALNIKLGQLFHGL